MGSAVTNAVAFAVLCRLQPALGFVLKAVPRGPDFLVQVEGPHPKDFMPDQPIDPVMQADTIRNFQKWITASPDGWSSLLAMGDSTMMGISVDMLNLTDEVLHAQNIVYAANDRGRPIQMGTMLEDGQEWHDEKQLDDPMVAAAVKRAQAATAALHSRKCTWGGGIQLYAYRESPLKGLVFMSWDFLPEYGEACWDACMGLAMQALKPSAVLWNIGFHLLNEDWDAEKCAKRQNPAKLNCGNYQKLVEHATTDFMKASPIVFWKTTNYLCEKKKIEWQPSLEETFAKWADPAQADALEAECHENCDKMKNFKCKDWVFRADTSELLYKESLAAVAHLQGMEQGHSSKLHVLDTFQATRSCCDRGCDVETQDGEHYRALDRGMIQKLASTLGAAAVSSA